MIYQKNFNDWKNTYVSDEYDSLDTSVNFEMESSVKDKQILYGKNRKVPITLKLYGGASVNEKITIFINNKPVKIDKKDYIKVKNSKRENDHSYCKFRSFRILTGSIQFMQLL